MPRSRTSLTAALAVVPLLLLTACTDGDEPADGKAKSAAAHPVFSKPLDLQPLAALEQTKQSGNAVFEQKVTFGSKKGDAVLTTAGRLDFTEERGTATRAWRVADGFGEDAKDTFLGSTPTDSRPAPSMRIEADAQHVKVRAGRAGYWLEFKAGGIGGAWEQSGPVTELHGTEAAIGGTLLEVVSGARITRQSPAPGGGRRYTAEVAVDNAGRLIPSDLHEELAPVWIPDASRPPAPLSLTVDARGRITGATVELSAVRPTKGPLRQLTSVRAELVLSGHSASPPAPPAEGERVLASEKSVVRTQDVKPGRCVDFDTGLRTNHAVVEVPCGGKHDGRMFDRVELSGENSMSAANAACADAHGRAPRAWTSEGDGYWTQWDGARGSDDARRGPSAVCYVASRS
ncbi:hypothetical protein [Streptomyces sp. NPDC050504]|uniref:hypothetical protein n=1 Tax=Streptomyces sp. NPDC050504 TaxID=3365618 RepID=UPI00378A6334